MLVPFLELLFDKTQLILKEPTFQWSKDYVIDIFYYFLSKQIQAKGKVSALAYFCIIVCVVFLLKNLFRYLALFVLAPLRNQLIFDLRHQLYEKTLKLPISFFQEEKKGSLLTKFTSDLNEIEYSIMNTIETSIQSPLNVILFLMAMFTISTPLTLFVFGMIIFMALFIGRIGKSLKKESKEGKEVLGKLTSIIDESISGIKIIQAYFVQDWIRNKFSTENKNYYDVFNKMYRKRDLSSPLTEFLAIIVVCIVLWFGGQLVLAGNNLNPSNFIAFMVIFSQLIPPAKSFSSAYYEIKKGMASFERIQEILNAVDSDDSKHQRSQVLSSFQNKIEFKNISFQYPNSQSNAIEDFSFTFEKGKKYALVGASGAGKSTLFDLILQFIIPQKGKIIIDDITIDSIDLKIYRSFFGLVSQEAILFNYSVSENIAFEALEKQYILNALQISNAKEFVDKMSQETYHAIGERGSKLSGGEKQRLSISRVAYRNPEIILLDEATSALDSKNEQEVQRALKNLLADKTSLIIAHRLSTIKEVDCILVMQSGKIVEVGTHNELLAKNGVYTEMVMLQNLK